MDLLDSLKRKTPSFFKKAKTVLAIFSVRAKKLISKKKEERASLNSLDFDKKLVYSLTKTKIPNFRQFKYVFHFLSKSEKRLVTGSAILIFVCLSFLSFNFYKSHLLDSPDYGGEYVEGALGAPQLINPLYASVNEADSDLAKLIYSSLFKRDAKGVLIGDLAKSYEIGENGKTYTIKLRDDAKWHDGSGVVQADDVIFTFQAIKDSEYHSPLRSSFGGVEIEKIDDETVRFILPEAYSAFLDLLNFGIMPSGIWSQISPQSTSLAEFNLKPIGSGPYKFKSLVKDKIGNIKVYTVTANSDYYQGSPYVTNFVFQFYPTEEELINALNVNDIDGTGYLTLWQKSKVAAQNSLHFNYVKMPQLESVFFNLRADSPLSDKKLRQALAYATNKKEILNGVYGVSEGLTDSPVLSDSFAFATSSKKYEYSKENASKILSEAGWKKLTITALDLAQAEKDKEAVDETVKNTALQKISLGVGEWLYKESNKTLNFLTIDLATVENEAGIKAANLIKKDWEAIGVKTIINAVSPYEIQNSVIKPRSFDALLYGQMLGADPDSYVFWHSSQAGSGLNISGYSNKETDMLLEDGRVSLDQAKRQKIYQQFQEILTNDVPAVFMFNLPYLYIQEKKLKGFSTESIIYASDRFDSVNLWYINTGKKIVW